MKDSIISCTVHPDKKEIRLSFTSPVTVAAFTYEQAADFSLSFQALLLELRIREMKPCAREAPIPPEPAPKVVPTPATLPEDKYLTMDDLARMFKRSKKSIQRARRRGELPPPFKLFGKHRWLASSIHEHLKAAQESAAATEARRARARLKHVP